MWVRVLFYVLTLIKSKIMDEEEEKNTTTNYFPMAHPMFGFPIAGATNVTPEDDGYTAGGNSFSHYLNRAWQFITSPITFLVQEKATPIYPWISDFFNRGSIYLQKKVLGKTDNFYTPTFTNRDFSTNYLNTLDSIVNSQLNLQYPNW